MDGLIKLNSMYGALDLDKISGIDEFRCVIEVSLGLDETRNHVERNDERDAMGFNAELIFTVAKVAAVSMNIRNKYDNHLRFAPRRSRLQQKAT